MVPDVAIRDLEWPGYCIPDVRYYGGYFYNFNFA